MTDDNEKRSLAAAAAALDPTIELPVNYRRQFGLSEREIDLESTIAAQAKMDAAGQTVRVDS